jgi:hypothetical protein
MWDILTVLMIFICHDMLTVGWNLEVSNVVPRQGLKMRLIFPNFAEISADFGIQMRRIFPNSTDFGIQIQKFQK